MNIVHIVHKGLLRTSIKNYKSTNRDNN